VAAENALNSGFGRSAASFIRSDQIRGHDENAPEHGNSAIVDEQAGPQSKGLFPSVLIPALAVVQAYERSVKQHQNPPPPNITKFIRGG
jgi:hypothetical protein